MTRQATTHKLNPDIKPNITIEILEECAELDLSDLCEITEHSIKAGGGFGWVTIPPRESLERYWNGVLTMPQRNLIVARLDGMICGAVQLVEPAPQNQAQSFAASIVASFVAPWARGYQIGAELLATAENLAIEKGYTVLHADIRDTQHTGIALLESLGYIKWGENPHYALIDDKMIRGLYYSKAILRPQPHLTTAI